MILEYDGITKTIYNKTIANSAVQGGELYTMSATGGASEDLKGKIITLQFILYDVESTNVEVCSEADLLVV